MLDTTDSAAEDLQLKTNSLRECCSRACPECLARAGMPVPWAQTGTSHGLNKHLKSHACIVNIGPDINIAVGRPDCWTCLRCGGPRIPQCAPGLHSLGPGSHLSRLLAAAIPTEAAHTAWAPQPSITLHLPCSCKPTYTLPLAAYHPRTAPIRLDKAAKAILCCGCRHDSFRPYAYADRAYADKTLPQMASSLLCTSHNGCEVHSSQCEHPPAKTHNVLACSLIKSPFSHLALVTL